MFNKLNSRTLLIIFAILLVIVLLIKFLESRKGERTFRSEIASFDIEDVTSLSITTKGDADLKLSLYKDGENWKAEKEGKSYNADATRINNLLSELLSMKPERVAATTKEKWGDFEVIDSLSVRVIVKKESKVLADLHIGKFSYQNPTNPYERQGKMTSYVRVDDDDITYAVDGFLRMTFNSDVNGYRNNKLCVSSVSDLTKLTFTYPADSSFTLIKQNDKWMVNGLLADSAKVVKYLGSIANLSSSNFVNEEPAAMVQSTHILRIEGNNMTAPVEISAIPADSTNQYLITSTFNKGTFFSGAKGGLFTKVFKGEDSFFEN